MRTRNGDDNLYSAAHSIKRESIFAVFKRFGVFIVTALFFCAAVAGLMNENRKSNAEKWLSAIPAPAEKPVMAPREFPDAVLQEETSQGFVLEQSAAVGDEYFADAVFAGDSLTDGFRIYDVGQHFDVISYVGLSPGTALTQPVYTTESGEALVLADAVKHIGARKAYVLLGTNGLNYAGTPENLISGYNDLVDQLMAVNPDTYIILESIPPVTAATAAARPSYIRENVEHYNNLVKQLAMDKGVYFLDVYSAFVGEDGYLSEDIAAPDGMHMTPDGYRIWFEYITTHTIKGNAAFAMDKDGRIIPMKPADETAPEEIPENTEQG